MRVSVRRADEAWRVAIRCPARPSPETEVGHLRARRRRDACRVSDGRRVLPRPGPGSTPVHGRRRHGRSGPDAVHPRGDEALQRAHGGDRRRRAAIHRRERPAGRVRPAPLRDRARLRLPPSRSRRVRSSARREPGRDRRTGHPRAARARHRGGRRLLDGRRDALHVELADQAVCIGPPAATRELPEDLDVVAAAETTAATRCTRVRLPRRERRVRPRVRRERTRLHRPAARGDGADGRQGAAKEAMRAAGVPLVPGWSTDRPRRPAPAAADAGFPSCSRQPRAVAERACGGRRRGCPRGRVRRRQRGGGGGVRRRLDLRRELVAPARHVEIQVLCDAEGGVLDARRARVLDPAAPPEARRGVPLRCARPGRREAWRRRSCARVARSGTGTPARSSSWWGRGRLLLPGGELPSPGGAPGHRARDGARPGARAVPWQPAAALATGRAEATAMRSSAASTPRTRPAASCLRRGPSRASSRRSDRGAGRHGRPLRQRNPTVLRLAHRESRWSDETRESDHRARRRALHRNSSSRASRRRVRSPSTSWSSPEFRRAASTRRPPLPSSRAALPSSRRA